MYQVVLAGSVDKTLAWKRCLGRELNASSKQETWGHVFPVTKGLLEEFYEDYEACMAAAPAGSERNAWLLSRSTDLENWSRKYPALLQQSRVQGFCPALSGVGERGLELCLAVLAFFSLANPLFFMVLSNTFIFPFQPPKCALYWGNNAA